VGEGTVATSAVGVATKDYVLDLDVADRELDDGKGVEVRGADDVGDVAVNENVAGL
jgi:hypothetical protein